MTFSPVPSPHLEATRASELLLKPSKPRDWFVQNLIPMNHVTLMYGDGGAGKSTLALQLACASVRSEMWLEQPTKSGPVYYLSCEDNLEEVKERLVSLGMKASDLHDLAILDQVGEDSYFINIGKDNEFTETALFNKLKADVEALKPKLVILDNLADIFPEDGYGRQLPRRFISLLRKFAMAHNCAILVLAHPSKAGINTGRGDDGSTAWSNSVRSRLYLVRDDDDEADAMLYLMKSNHSPKQQIKMRYVDGGFLHQIEEPLDVLNAKADQKFMQLMHWHEERGINLNRNSGRNYAPTRFAAHPDSDKMTKERFRQAMERLLYNKSIKSVNTERSSKLVVVS